MESEKQTFMYIVPLCMCTSGNVYVCAGACNRFKLYLNYKLTSYNFIRFHTCTCNSICALLE